MFKEFYESGPNQTPNSREQGLLTSIEVLTKGMKDETIPITVRLVRTNALIELLRREKDAGNQDINLKINLAEAETYKHELEEIVASDKNRKEGYTEDTMFTSPENRSSGEEMDLDFTKPESIPGMEIREDHSSTEEKIAELQNNIAATERGIKLAQSLNDGERVAQMKKKKEEFEATLAMFQPQTPKQVENEVADIGAFLTPDDRKFDRKTLGE